jgi:hypothetical protein
MKRLAQITKRLNKLADLLLELKDRVRQAITGELGRIVARTVEDAVHSVLRRGDDPPTPQRETPFKEPSDTPNRPGPAWDEDPWNDRFDDPDRFDPELDREPVTEVPNDSSRTERWRCALDLGTAVLRWWLLGRWTPWVGLGVAGAIGVAAGWGGSLGHAGGGLLRTAAELLSFHAAGSLR